MTLKTPKIIPQNKNQSNKAKLTLVTSFVDTEKSFREHINELKTKFFISIISLVVFSVIGYFISPFLIKAIIFSRGEVLYYTSPTGGFNFILEVSILFGFLASIPVFLYNILSFISPALPKANAKTLNTFLISSIILAILGVSFAYYISLPAAIEFLSQFGTGYLKSLLSADEYLKFVATYLIGFGLTFQLPIILFVINIFVKLKPKAMLKYLRHVILVSFIIAGVLTPTPDIINQTIMAMPIILIYLLSVILIWRINAIKVTNG